MKKMAITRSSKFIASKINKSTKYTNVATIEKENLLNLRSRNTVSVLRVSIEISPTHLIDK